MITSGYVVKRKHTIPWKVNMYLPITLTPEEQEKIIEMCKKKLELEKGKKVWGTINRNTDRLSNFIQGFGAELACYKEFGQEYDYSVPIRKNNIDIWINNVPIDVKETKLPFGMLIDDKRHNSIHNLVRAYLLMVGKFPTYENKGWTTRKELHKPENIQVLQSEEYPVYAMKQHYLKRIEINETTLNQG